MAPTTSASTDTASDTSSPSATLGLQIVLAVSLPLVFLSLVVFKAVVFYRRRVRRDGVAGGQSVLSVGVTVDVDKVVDLPYAPNGRGCRELDYLAAKRTTVAYAGTVSSFDMRTRHSSLLTIEDVDVPGVTNPVLQTPESPSPCHILPDSPPQPLRRVPLGSYFKTYPSSASVAARSRLSSFSAAFPAMDVDALAQSTIPFPRLPPTLDKESLDISGYPTIPSLPSATLAMPPSSDAVTTSDDANDNCTNPDSQHDLDISQPASDDSLGTLVDSSPGVQDLDYSAHIGLYDEAGSLEKSSSVTSGRPSTPEVKLDESSPLAGRPISSYSPLVALSLSPLRASLSPGIDCATYPTPPRQDRKSATGTPDLAAFVATATPLLDEWPPDSPHSSLSIATFKEMDVAQQSLRVSDSDEQDDCRHPGRVLQPLFENSASFECSRTDFAHMSVASLRSAFTLSRSPPTCFSLASLSRPPSSRPTPSKRVSVRICESPPSSLPQLALSSPVASFHVSLSQISTSADITAPYSPSLLGSPFQRPRAPTPGSVDSRLFAYGYPSDDHGPLEHHNDFLAPMAYDRTSSRLSMKPSLESLSPSSPFSRPRAPTPGSLASFSMGPEHTPQLLPPLNLNVIPPLSL
ncbi:hypothetical protein PsYK624_110990 [Phanerochaete sordida]|uniref:Uncharacterized protein n=1 Tax=Phanerochaete sordida TaxID=48140 RepID=A0A9P3GF66_9APHY|nr:hypothetical protein PsYK624_110990 [Phanerochaete sordida]